MRYRPSYPTAVYTHLHTHCNLTPDSIIADIGSETGLLAQLFWERRDTVFGRRRRLFAEYEENGRVLFQFVTKLYYAKRPLIYDTIAKRMSVYG